MVEKESKEIYSFGVSCIFLSSCLAMFLGLGSYIMFNLSKNDTYIAVIIGSLQQLMNYKPLINNYFAKKL